MKSDHYTKAKTKLEYVCSAHKEYGSQFITWGNLVAGFGCRYCGQESTASARRLSFDEVKNIFAEHNMELVENQEYINSSIPMQYICARHPECGIQLMSTANARKNHCPYCRQSKGEAKIRQFLTSHNITFQSQKKFDELLGVGGGKLSYDFYIPHRNLLIEYQGNFHDGTAGSIQTNEEFQRQKIHDERKREYSQKHNIKLLEIWYPDFENIEVILSQYI